MLELDCGQDFDPSLDEDFFAALPPRPAVCLVETHAMQAEPFLFRTQDLRRRLQRLLGPPEPGTKRLNLRDLAARVRYRLTGSKFEQAVAYYHIANHLFPKRYRKLTRLRPPAVLKISLRNAYPRCYVTRTIPVDDSGVPTAGAYYGPFPSRKAADAFSQRALDFFKVRRCQIKIRRDPTFPGCIYSEMKMCLAPCFAGCTEEEYATEVGRLVQFLDTSGTSLRSTIETDREQASADLDFERAALLHKRVEKLDDALRLRPELARRIEDLNLVILQRAAEEQSIAVFAFRSGRLAEPFFLRFAEIASQPRSAEHIFKDYLEGFAANTIHSPNASAAAPSATTADAAPDIKNVEARFPGPNLEGSASPSPDHESIPASEASLPKAAPSRPSTESVVPTSPTANADAKSLPPSASREQLGEHLALLSRWYYSNPRQGEIFFREKDWPYRKILRACSRLLNPKAPEPSAPQAAPEKSTQGNS